MNPQGRPGELFAAYSRITARVFAGDRLISCPTLSKAPNYGNVLRRFLIGAPHVALSRSGLVKLCFRYCLTNKIHFFFLLLCRLYIAVLRWKPAPALGAENVRAAKKPLLLVDTFAVLPKIAEEGRFQDIYLPGLWEEAIQSGREPVRLYRLYGSRNPLVLWKAFRVLAAQGGGVTEAHLFTLKDWFSLWVHGLLYPFALYKLIRSLTHYAPETPEAYIRDALIQTAGQCILLGEGRRLAGFRLGMWLAASPMSAGVGAVPGKGTDKAEAKAPVIASWYENQVLNKAFQRGLAQAESRTGRHIRVVGAQFFIWPDNLLNNHPDEGEIALGLTPDLVLVNGTYFLPEVSSGRYDIGPAMRYKALFTQETVPGQGVAGQSAAGAVEASAFLVSPPSSSAEKPLLVLLSYHPEETRRVLELVLPLAGKGVKPVYKFHPATRPEDFTPWLPADPVLAAGSLAQALKNAGAVIGSGSGSLAEAVAVGVPVLAVEDPAGIAGLGLNYLPPFGKGELWEEVRSAHEVEAALQTLQRGFADPARPAKVAAFRDLLFTEPTSKRIKEAFGL